MASSSVTDPLTPSSTSYRLGRLVRLARKEMTEILRDRRTIVTLVAMPLILYPLMMIAFRIFTIGAKLDGASAMFRIGFATSEDEKMIMSYLLPAQQDLVHVAEATETTVRVTELRSGVTDNLEEEIRQGRLDLGLRPRNQAAPLPGQFATLDCEVLYREDSVYGREGLAYVQKLCAARNPQLLSNLLHNGGIRIRPDPFRPIPQALTSSQPTSVSMAVFVPLVLILMTITGAVYPAIDLTAGERERGTLEVLVAAPIPRMSVLFGKYVAVLSVAVLTALINLTGMTLAILLSGQADRVFGPSGLSLVSLVQVLGLVLLFAAFFSAVLLVLTSFARSFKEAQAYLIPLMLVALVPGILGLVPGLSLNSPLAVVPLLNIVLLARDLLEGKAHLVAALLVVLSTAFYAGLALFVAAQLFGAEAVLYSESGGLRAWFHSRKKPR